MLRRALFKFDWFLKGMIGAVLLAWLLPEPGATGGWLHPEILTKAGVSLIFFLHGAALPFAALRSGMLRWRLHLVVQLTTYLIFPLIGLALYVGLPEAMAPELRLGVFFLCALPSTVSSSVAMTAAAKGNVPGAVFNATLSSLLGVVLTPLWIGLALQVEGQGLPLADVVLDLLRWLVAPLVLGQLSRPAFGAWFSRHKAKINVVDKATILLMVYTSFCDSFLGGVWSRSSSWTLALVLAVAAALFAAVMKLTSSVSHALGFSREDTITAMFCGSKKTLAAGVPMAKLLFAGNAGLGLILLPLMIYHPLQLLACGMLVSSWKQREARTGQGGAGTTAN